MPSKSGVETEDEVRDRSEVKEKLELFVSTTGAFRPAKTTARLIEECGSASAVFGAPRHRIERVVGKSSRVGTALRTARWLSLNAFETIAEQRPLLRSRKALLCYLAVAMAQDELETVRILFTNPDLRLLKSEVVHIGSRFHTNFDERFILRRALELGASGMILVHNHPSGNPQPSTDDYRATTRLSRYCQEFDVHLVDHIVVGIHGGRSVIWGNDWE